MKGIQNFKELLIWQKGMEIVKETYGLISQMRRSAVSIPSNIAEGFKRLHKKEFRQFLHIALGSAAELETQLILSESLKYANSNEIKKSTNNINQLSRMTYSLLKNIN